jgi:ABC-type lipoprotein release transport system permease subunit
MSVLRLVMREMVHRKLNLLFATLPVVFAVALVVAALTLSRGMNREITRLMKDMGFNVDVRPARAEGLTVHSEQFGEVTMPEGQLDRLAKSNVMTVRHLLGRLEGLVEWQGREVLLVGTRYEQVEALPGEKPPMGDRVKPGQAYVGSDLAEALGMEPGETIELPAADGGTRSFAVTNVLKERGSWDDRTIFLNLADAQELLGKPGQITRIEALSCHCAPGELVKVSPAIEEFLNAQDGPDVIAELDRSRALARAETRDKFERYARWVLGVVLVVCALWVGLLFLANVHERRAEIGVLRALGTGSGTVAALFLLKAVFIGLAGALIGFLVGVWPVLMAADTLFPMTGAKLAADYSLLGMALVGAPIFCALAAYLPTMIAVTQDPAEVLREE